MNKHAFSAIIDTLRDSNRVDAKLIAFDEMVQCEWCGSLHKPTHWGYEPRNLHFCSFDHMDQFDQWRWSVPDRERD